MLRLGFPEVARQHGAFLAHGLPPTWLNQAP